MFAFIRKFFENRRKRAAERDNQCCALLDRLEIVLSDYAGLDKNDKGSLRKWLAESDALFSELDDISKFKRSLFYKLLKRRKQSLAEFREEASNTIQIIIAKEAQKCADDEYVAKRLNQWAAKNKQQKISASKPHNLKQTLKKLNARSCQSDSEYEACLCCGKDGKRKMLYSTECDAQAVAEYRSKIIGMPLCVYPCPSGLGFHITSNPN